MIVVHEYFSFLGSLLTVCITFLSKEHLADLRVCICLQPGLSVDIILPDGSRGGGRGGVCLCRGGRG